MGLQLFSKEAIVMQYFLLLGLSLFSPCDSQMFFMASMPTKEQTMKHFLKVDANGDPITPDRIQSGRVPECDDGKVSSESVPFGHALTDAELVASWYLKSTNV